jgi:hypothetical protein
MSQQTMLMRWLSSVFFAGNGPGVSKLRRVLIAYSWRDPSIGYCQGGRTTWAALTLLHGC